MKTLIVALMLLPVVGIAQVDTLDAVLKIKAIDGIRYVKGFVVLQKADTGCVVKDYLTFKMVKFPKRFSLKDYRLQRL